MALERRMRSIIAVARDASIDAIIDARTDVTGGGRVGTGGEDVGITEPRGGTGRNAFA